MRMNDTTIIPNFENKRASEFWRENEFEMNKKILANEILAIDQSIYSRLFDHQIQGITFLYKNF